MTPRDENVTSSLPDSFLLRECPSATKSDQGARAVPATSM